VEPEPPVEVDPPVDNPMLDVYKAATEWLRRNRPVKQNREQRRAALRAKKSKGR
jgi:hypothetical protein